MAGINDYFDSIDDVYSSAVDQGEAYVTAVAEWLQSLGATSGDDPVYTPVIISGTGLIRWVDGNGAQRPKSAPFTISTVDGISYAVGGVTYSYIEREYSGSVIPASISIIHQSAYPDRLYTFSAASSRTININVEGNPAHSSTTSSVRVYSVSESTAPLFSFNQSSSFSTIIGVTSVNFSTVSSDSNAHFNLPVGGTEVTYNDIVPMVVNIVNEDFPAETITEDDLPSFDDALPTEPPDPTEPSGGGGDTYINNGSLYWNSGDGTQNIYDMDADVTETVETFDNYEDELRTLEFETLPSVTEDANTLEVASSMVEGGLSMLPTGFLDIIMPASIFCAVISMLIRR